MRGPGFLILAVLLLAWTGFGAARAAGTQVLHGHMPAAVAQLPPVARLAGTNHLRLAIGLPLRNREQLNQLLRELYDPASPRFRHYLTPEQFAEQFGPTEADYQAVIEFARTSGFTVTATHLNRAVLSVSGSVADIEKALHVTMRVYNHPTEARTFYAPENEPALDAPVTVLDISGLDTYALPHPHHRVKPVDLSAQATPNAGSGPGGTYRGNDFRAAYVPGTTLTGAGQNVGLLQFDGYYSNDIASYISQCGISTSVILTNIAVDGGVGTPGIHNNEVCLDIEMAIAMAPGLAGIFVYEAPNFSPWVDLLSRMANDNVCKQLSCSWGGSGVNAAAEQIFQQMAAQGQSFFNATGDSDAFTGSIAFPSDSTNITQVGGTTLTTGSGAAYSSETVWNRGGGIGSSGGTSTYYPIPSYQLGINMTASQGSTSMRNVPDVALTADNIWVTYNNGGTGVFGGTSCAAPLWAGFTALVNQQAAAGGLAPVGFLNPALYTIGQGAGYTTNFHDITTGNNTWSNSPSKYYAVTGYDLCTGWGTPNGTNLINTLAPPATAPVIVAAGATLLIEGCTPTNGVIDSDETVTVIFALQNISPFATSNLVATLLAANGVTAPSAPQTYGVLSSGTGPVAQPYTFTATGTCGSAITAALQLQDGPNSLGTVTNTFILGKLSAVTTLTQNFDAVTAPALPAGWTTAASGAQALWVTSTTNKDTSPNAAFTAGAAAVGVNELVSPAFPVYSTAAQLRFRHNYNLQTNGSYGLDGGVLEIKIGANAFADIVFAGGSFSSNGYVLTIGISRGNPLAGSQGWSGNSGGFVTTIATLPPSAVGQTVQLKWRCGTDNSTNSVGWYIDSISVTDSNYVCCAGVASPVADFSASPTNGTVPLNVTFSDISAGTITNRFWTFGDGATSNTTATTMWHTYAAAGTSTVTLVVSGPGGMTSKTQANLIVAVLPPPSPLFLPGSGVSVNPATGQAMITFPITNGYQYRIVYKDDLLSTNDWTPVDAAWHTATNTAILALPDTNTVGVTQRFYRIQARVP